MIYSSLQDSFVLSVSFRAYNFDRMHTRNFILSMIKAQYESLSRDQAIEVLEQAQKELATESL